MEIYFHLVSPPCHSSSGNENKDKSKFIKPECAKFYWVRYELQCERGGTTIKVLPAMCKKNDLHIYAKTCGKTWINENNIVEGLPFPDMTCIGTQYKFDSELWLINA